MRREVPPRTVEEGGWFLAGIVSSYLTADKEALPVRFPVLSTSF